MLFGVMCVANASKAIGVVFVSLSLSLPLLVGKLNETYVKYMLTPFPFYDDGRQEALIFHVKLFDLCMRMCVCVCGWIDGEKG